MEKEGENSNTLLPMEGEGEGSHAWWSMEGQLKCHNPTLAKCGGETQHLEKVRIWSPPGLPNIQSSTARPKTPPIEVFLVSLERS